MVVALITVLLISALQCSRGCLLIVYTLKSQRQNRIKTEYSQDTDDQLATPSWLKTVLLKATSPFSRIEASLYSEVEFKDS